MARYVPTPEKSKTLTVQSGVNVAGLAAGQIAEVDDTQQTRDLIAAGLWFLLITETELEAILPDVTVGDTLPEV